MQGKSKAWLRQVVTMTRLQLAGVPVMPTVSGPSAEQDQGKGQAGGQQDQAAAGKGTHAKATD